MRVAWLADDPGYVGGAELTEREFKAACPPGHQSYYSGPDQMDVVLPGRDVVCVFNCVTYPAETIQYLEGKRVVRYWNDLAPHGSPELRQWLIENAVNVFCSPLQAERFSGAASPHFIPPPVPLERFREAARASEERSGAVSVAAWQNPGKGPHLAQEWARGNGGITFYGGGPYAPEGSAPVRYEDMPEILARFKEFVFLPTALEPFGRCVVEAWASGCVVVTNRLVGARYWIDEKPEALDTAAEDFWRLVLSG